CLLSGALKQARFVVSGLEVDARRMREVLDITNGLVVSEAVMMGLGRYLGREYAHDLVYDICREAIRQKRPLLDLLAENNEITKHLGRAELTRLCDPANYLGQSRVMVDRVLESVRAKRSPVDLGPGHTDARRNVQESIVPRVRSAG